LLHIYNFMNSINLKKYDVNLYGQKAKRTFLKITYRQKDLLRGTGHSLIDLWLKII
jgi:hypothetical protein